MHRFLSNTYVWICNCQFVTISAEGGRPTLLRLWTDRHCCVSGGYDGRNLHQELSSTSIKKCGQL